MRHLLLLLVLSWPLAAVGQQWIEGTHYERVPGQHEPREDGRIEVVEAFWYGCPSCYTFEPHLLRWLETKPDDVAFVRVPASLNPSWRVHARAYHAADTLGVLDAMHERMFRTIHMERNGLGSVEALAELFTTHAGVSAEEFRTTYNSFGVETRMRRGDALVRGYRVSGVPSVIVNRRYRSNPGMSRGYEHLIQLVDYLIELERQTADNPE